MEKEAIATQVATVLQDLVNKPDWKDFLLSLTDDSLHGLARTVNNYVYAYNAYMATSLLRDRGSAAAFFRLGQVLIPEEKDKFQGIINSLEKSTNSNSADEVKTKAMLNITFSQEDRS